jgi:glycosyltransferase involved in cell wall biosynthesis
LLERLAAEPGQERIEVCVSDNASLDGTELIVERHSGRFGERLRYRRNDRNLGWGENLLRSVELSQGDYCWLMGSDDAPAPGSIRRLLELIDEHDGTSGIHVGHLRVTPDLQRVGTAVASESYPTERVTTRMLGAEEVAIASYLTLFLSNNVVHRARWQQVADAERSTMYGFPLVPHMYMMGRIAATHPDWVWCPELLVISREGDIFLREPGEIGLDTRIVRQLIAELDRLWKALHGSSSYVHRALMFKALRQMATRDALLELRMSVERLREHIALIGLTRHFWWSRQYWLRSLPALLVPVAPLRYASGGPRRRASRRIRAHDRNVEVLGGLPNEMYAGYATWVSVRVVNRASVALSSAGPFSVWLACRWEDPDTGQVAHSGSPTKLWPALRPGTSRVVELSITPPPLPGRYSLVIAPVEHYDGWYDLDQSASGLSSMVDVRRVPGRQPGEIVASTAAEMSRASASGAETVETLTGLTEMMSEVREADGQWQASTLRERNSALTLRVLATDGFEAARHTLNDALLEQSVNTSRMRFRAGRAWHYRPGAAVLGARPQSPRGFARFGRRVDAIFVAMAWDFARGRLGSRLDELEEPRPDGGFTVRFRGRLISRSLAASALELATITEAVPVGRLATARVIEFGGGYGGLAWVMLSLHREARYVLVDIPPALAIAQHYLSETLPERRVFRFRRFGDPAEVIDELLSSEIAFLTPNQLALLPAFDADLWLSIFSLHGLSREHMRAQFEQADRHVTGWAYTRQWRVSVSPIDGVAVEQPDYPYPSHWRRVLERPHPMQRESFEAVFENGHAPARAGSPTQQ